MYARRFIYMHTELERNTLDSNLNAMRKTLMEFHLIALKVF